MLQMGTRRPCTSPCARSFRVRTLQLPELVYLSGDLDLLAFHMRLSPCSSCCRLCAGWEEELCCTKKGSCLKCLNKVKSTVIRLWLVLKIIFKQELVYFKLGLKVPFNNTENQKWLRTSVAKQCSNQQNSVFP